MTTEDTKFNPTPDDVNLILAATARGVQIRRTVSLEQVGNRLGLEPQEILNPQVMAAENWLQRFLDWLLADQHDRELANFLPLDFPLLPGIPGDPDHLEVVR